MKRMIALMLSVIMVMLMVAACGDAQTTTNTTVTTQTTTEATTAATTTATTEATTVATVDTTVATTVTTEATTVATTEATTVATTAPDPMAKYESSLIMHLDFDDWDIDTNIIKDVTGNGHDGQATKRVGIENGPEGFGDAAGFSNLGDLITVKNSDDLNFTVEDEFTIQFWYKPDENLYNLSNSTWPCVFQKGEKYDGWYGVWVPKTGIAWGGDAGNIFATTKVKTDWQLVTIVQKDGKVSTYVDGLSGATVAAADYTSDFDLWIGGQCRDKGANVTQQFYGCIDEFKIYSVALDYQAITGIVVEKPAEEKAIVKFDFEEIKDGKFIDSASGLEAVISGTVTVGEGKNGNAAIFDSVNDLLTIADNDLLDLKRTQNYTIEIVYKADVSLFNTEDTSGWPCMFQKGASGTGWYGIWFNKTFIHWGGQAGNHAIKSDLARDPSNNVLDTEWHTILIVQNAEQGTITTYIDGVAGKSLTAQDYTSAYDLYIGGKINDTAFQRFVGAIDEFNIYNYAFDADAIADSAN